MCLVEIAQHEKIFAYIQQWVYANKAARQLFSSLLMFCFRELNRFLEISVRDHRKILRVSRNSKLDLYIGGKNFTTSTVSQQLSVAVASYW